MPLYHRFNEVIVPPILSVIPAIVADPTPPTPEPPQPPTTGINSTENEYKPTRVY